MNLFSLLELYLPETLSGNALSFNNNHTGINGFEVDNTICAFINNLSTGSPITQSEFRAFFAWRKNLSDDLIRKNIDYIILETINKIYKNHEIVYKDAIERIEEQGKSASHDPICQKPNFINFSALLNCHYLLSRSEYIEIKIDNFGIYFPNLNYDNWDRFRTDIPLYINAFTLTGRIPQIQYLEIDTTKPLYPLTMPLPRSELSELTDDINTEKSDFYFPYATIQYSKNSQECLRFTNRKSLFIKIHDEYKVQDIFASKIAEAIGGTSFFSSASKVLDNGIVVTAMPREYGTSVADATMRAARGKYIGTDKKVFPGTGIIEEVSNFVGNKDVFRHTENLAFSSKQIDEAYLIQINFHNCEYPVSKDAYERGALTARHSIYSHLTPIREPEYIKETLFARLKLALLPEPLLVTLAAQVCKHHWPNFIQNYIARTDIALNLLLENVHLKTFMVNNPKLIKHCQKALEKYIREHCKPEDHNVIISSLQERYVTIKAQIKAQLENKKALCNIQHELNNALWELHACLADLGDLNDKPRLCASELYSTIYGLQEQLIDKKIDFPSFKTLSIEAIKTALPQLDGTTLKQAAYNVLLCIAGLGILYGLAICVNKAVNDRFLFFPPPVLINIKKIQEFLNNTHDTVVTDTLS